MKTVSLLMPGKRVHIRTSATKSLPFRAHGHVRMLVSRCSHVCHAPRYISPHKCVHLNVAGPAAAIQRVFLSPATLLIVPAPLVQHWVFQVQQHTRFGAMRLLVLSSDRDRSNRMPPVHSLAWDYDLVISSCFHQSARSSMVGVQHGWGSLVKF